MIDELRTKGYTATEIVNFLVLGQAIEPQLTKRADKPAQPYQEPTSLIHNDSPEKYWKVKGKSFSPTTEEIERGKSFFRKLRAAATLQDQPSASSVENRPVNR